MQRILPDIASGSDLLLIARPPLTDSTLEETDAALRNLLKRANLLISSNV